MVMLFFLNSLLILLNKPYTIFANFAYSFLENLKKINLKTGLTELKNLEKCICNKRESGYT